MSSVEDVWASMQSESDAPTGGLSIAALLAQAEGPKRCKGSKRDSGAKSQVERKAERSSTEAAGTGKGSAVVQVAPPLPNLQATDENIPAASPPAPGRVPIDAKDLLLRIMRTVETMTNSEEPSARKQALSKLHRTLFEEFLLSDSDYSVVFRELAKPIFKRFADPVEKCREGAFKLTQAFFECSSDLVLVLGYFIPALMQRVPSGVTFDEEMKVFVFDKESHEAYRRGKAVDRQDKVDALQPITVVEASEELRLLSCVVLATLIRKLCGQGAASVLHPYFFEVIIFIQTQLRDPFPDTKAVACGVLEFMSVVEEFNMGFKFFAVGLVRAILPVLRHKHTKVRVAALGALRSCLSVPDRAKLRGAGTEAIPDLVGFREDNVLNVAAFYKSDVQINYLAELVQDKSVQVREKLVEMLSVLLTEIGDRYDHQTRLLPYLLDLLTDEATSVADSALKCLRICGKQYEEDHKDEIIERRQYGVDGDNRINLDKPLPKPFTERPRIGMRLYVRGNTKRFLTALVNELTNWVSQTRMKSANLLKMIVVLCEEHLTMEAHTLLPSFIKAIGFAKQDGDGLLHELLLEVFELMGRYILPETYIHFILPRLTGDPSVTQFGVDSLTRISVMEFLGSLLSGSKSSELIPHFESLTAAITDPFVISPDSPTVVGSAVDVVLKMLTSMRGKGNAAIQAHFLATGRLTNLKGTVSSLFSWFIMHLNNPALSASVFRGLLSLSKLESDSSGNSDKINLQILFDSSSRKALETASRNYELFPSIGGSTNHEHNVLTLLAESPYHSVQKQEATYSFFLDFACSSMEKVIVESGMVEKTYVALNDLLVSLIAPTVYRSSYSIVNTVACACISDFLSENGNGSQELGSSTSAMSKSRLIDLQGLSEKELVPAVNVVEGFVSRIFDAFVFHSKWSHSQALQLARLDLLAAMIGLSPSPSDATVNENLKRCVIDGVIVKMFPTLIEKVMNHAKSPGNSLRIRLVSVKIVGRCFTQMIRSWYWRDDLASLLKSFAYWGTIGAKERSDEMGRRIEAQKQAQGGLALLVAMLDDGSDEVRLLSLIALNGGVALVMPDECEVSSVVTFDALCARLLRETAVVTNSEAFFEALDQALRSLAVLFPARLSELATKQLEGLSHLASGSLGLQVLSDVLDHCEILKQLK